MSNIAYAEKIVLSNEGISKKELVELIAKELNVSIPNARVYVYNVSKRLAKGPKVAKVSKKPNLDLRKFAPTQPEAAAA